MNYIHRDNIVNQIFFQSISDTVFEIKRMCFHNKY